MKTMSIITKKLTFIIIASLVFIACDSKQTVHHGGDDVSSVTELLLDPSGFQVHEFVEEGVNKTGLFRSYVFTFREDGSVAAIGEDEQISGRYLVFEDDGLTELKLMFPDVSAFSELSDDWYLISQNGGAFRFVDNRNVIEFRRNHRIDGGASGGDGAGDGGSGGDDGNGDGGNGDGGSGDGGSGGDSGDSGNSGSVASIVAALTHSNGLKIDEFIEDGFNETSDFQSYVFLFDVDGTVVASSSGSGNGSGSGSTINVSIFEKNRIYCNTSCCGKFINIISYNISCCCDRRKGRISTSMDVLWCGEYRVPCATISICDGNLIGCAC